MLADGHSLLDEEVEILWDVCGQTLRLEDTQDLTSRNKSRLRDTKRVSKDDTLRDMTHNVMSNIGPQTLTYNQYVDYIVAKTK